MWIVSKTKAFDLHGAGIQLTKEYQLIAVLPSGTLTISATSTEEAEKRRAIEQLKDALFVAIRAGEPIFDMEAAGIKGVVLTYKSSSSVVEKKLSAIDNTLERLIAVLQIDVARR